MTDLDAELFRWLHDALSEGVWFWPLVFLSVIGGGWGAFLLVPLYASPRTRPHAKPLAIVLVVTAVVVYALKRMIARERPHVSDIKALLFAPPTDFSFPSGHASGSFAFTMFLAIVVVRTWPAGERRRWLVAGLLVSLAVGVGLSRIALGVHFPGDVLGGALLGSSIATVGAQVHLERWRRGAP